MTLLFVVLVLALLGTAAVKFGADTRESGGWAPRTDDGSLWTERHV